MMKRCYDAEMRTTISIDDELLNIARSMAEQKNASIGTVVSDLIRSGLHRRTEYKIDDGLPVFEARDSSQVITLEDVKKVEDEIW